MTTCLSSCPTCMQQCVRSGPPGTSSLAHYVPSWSIEFLCFQCGQQPWFECCLVCCNLPAHKNLFHDLKQLRHHAHHCHRLFRAPTVKHSAGAIVNAVHHWELDSDDSLDFSQPDNSSEIECSSSTSSSDGPSDTFELECFPSTDKSPTFSFAKFGTAQFAEWVIAGDVITATHCLVQQSLMQAPVSLYLDISAKLAPHAIKLFLNIAKSLMTTGQAHHDVLSTILELLLDMIPPDSLEWPTMPLTISGFQSHVLNPTNKHSLVTTKMKPNHDQGNQNSAREHHSRSYQ